MGSADCLETGNDIRLGAVPNKCVLRCLPVADSVQNLGVWDVKSAERLSERNAGLRCTCVMI